MLVQPTMETLLKKISSRYTLTVLAAKRARQLVNGGQPLAKSATPNYVTVACEEISSGKVIAVKGSQKVHVPLRPEIQAEREKEEYEKMVARKREEEEEVNNARIRSLMAAVEKTTEGDEDIDNTEESEDENGSSVMDDLIKIIGEDDSEEANDDEEIEDEDEEN